VTILLRKKRAEWKAFGKAVDPRELDRVMRRNLRRATALNGKNLERTVRKKIQGGKFTPNADLTIAIKGSSKPLVDTGHRLFQAVTSRVVDEFTVWVGIQFKDRFYNVAKLLHDGGAIGVTDRMRGLFYVLWLASIGAIPESELTGRAAELWARKPGGWFPLSDNTRAIMIPSRPFLAQAIEDARLRRVARANWVAAIKAAFRELAEEMKT
jgi:hypothetical protein